jgi:tripartite-type tricarboxylate transporter receptor subunit TctC
VYVILPSMHDSLPFDLGRDFVPVGLVAQVPMMIAAAPHLHVATLAELSALSRRRPSDIFYAASSPGSLPHLTAEMWRDQSGAEMTFVPYPGVSAGLQDLMGGRVSVIVESVGALSAAIKAGSIKPLAVASSARLTDYPDLPTIAESIPGFAAVGWMVLTAPAGTAAEVVTRLSADLGTVLAEPDLQKRYRVLGALIHPMTPSETARYIADQQRLWKPTLRRLHLRTP